MANAEDSATATPLGIRTGGEEFLEAVALSLHALNSGEGILLRETRSAERERPQEDARLVQLQFHVLER
jgi:hypothetical protein